MCIICKGEDIPNLTALTCADCDNLQSLPDLPRGLIKLYCYNCTNLQSLPILPQSITEIVCSGCSNLQFLPILPRNLNVLYHWGCKNLLYVPDTSHVNHINEGDCPKLKLGKIKIPILQR